MSRTELSRAQDLRKIVDEARQQIATLDEPWDDGANAYVGFDSLSTRQGIEGLGHGQTWEGFVLPRDLALEMLAWLHDRAARELQGLGVNEGAAR